MGDALEVGTGRASTVTIEASSGLTQDEINALAARQQQFHR